MTRREAAPSQNEITGEFQKGLLCSVHGMLGSLQAERGPHLTTTSTLLLRHSLDVIGQMTQKPGTVAKNAIQKLPNPTFDRARPDAQKLQAWFLSSHSLNLTNTKVSAGVQLTITGLFGNKDFQPEMGYKGTMALDIKNRTNGLNILKLALFFEPSKLLGVERGEFFYIDRLHRCGNTFTLTENSPDFLKQEEALYLALKSLLNHRMAAQIPGQALNG